MINWNSDDDVNLRIDSILEDAVAGNNDAIDFVIEPIGNDEAVTKAFVELIALARVDDSEDVRSNHYSARIHDSRNRDRAKAFKKLTELADDYYSAVLEVRESSND